MKPRSDLELETTGLSLNTQGELLLATPLYGAQYVHMVRATGPYDNKTL